MSRRRRVEVEREEQSVVVANVKGDVVELDESSPYPVIALLGSGK